MEVSIVIPIEIIEDSIIVWGQVRRENGPMNGMFEFPGGKIEEGENSLDAAIREFSEEVGFAITDVELFTQYAHDYADRSVNLFVYVTNYTKKMGLIAQKISFENAKNEVDNLNIPQANRVIIMRLVEHCIRENENE